MMAHALAPQAAAPSPRARKQQQHSSPPPGVGGVGGAGPHRLPREGGTSITTPQRRRALFYGLVGAGLGSGLRVGEANAAGRRPPPPPPSTEKKDPNVSGVQAKVLASIKRKEAMKEAMAELRKRGKPINEPPPPISQPPQPIIETPQ